MNLINWVFSKQYSFIDMMLIAFGTFMMQEISFFSGLVFIVIMSVVLSILERRLSKLS